MSEQVQVEANANLVETRNAGVGQVIDNQRVLELPLNGRQATELIYLSGIATPPPVRLLRNQVARRILGSKLSDHSHCRGRRNRQRVTYSLDGGSHNDPFNNLNLPFPSGCATGVQGRDQRSPGAVWTSLLGGRQRRDQIRHQCHSRRRLRVCPQQCPQRPQRIRSYRGRTQTQPIWRNAGDANQAEQALCVLGGQTTLQRTTPNAFIAFVPTAQMLSGDFTASPARMQ